jgi:hypothetical protein
VRRFLKENSLSIFFGLGFLAALGGQAIAGWHQFNDQQVGEHLAQVSLSTYLTSVDFAVDVAENWQSEYLQFLLYILATVWFLQRGSPESKTLDQAGLESDEEQRIGRHAGPDSPKWARVGGLRTRVYSWSLTLVIGSQGRGAATGPFPHPPFNPCVRFSRTRLTDGVLGMVTQLSGSEWSHGVGTDPSG